MYGPISRTVDQAAVTALQDWWQFSYPTCKLAGRSPLSFVRPHQISWWQKSDNQWLILLSSICYVSSDCWMVNTPLKFSSNQKCWTFAPEKTRETLKWGRRHKLAPMRQTFPKDSSKETDEQTELKLKSALSPSKNRRHKCKRNVKCPK